MDTLTLDVDDRLAVVTINRPEVRNALSRQVLAELRDVLAELRDVLAELRERDDVGIVAFTGAGEKAFVAGADISQLRHYDLHTGLDAEMQRTFDAVEAFPKPTVAAVNGFALGGGCELAMACDIRIAAQSASFGQPEISLGIIPGFGGTQRLPRLIGEARALEMNLTGDPISAQVAYEYGLANRVVPDHELWDTALAWAHKLSDQAPRAVKQIKRVSAAGDLDAGIEAEKQAFAKVFGSEDAREGITAFLQKRKPSFRGK